MGLRSDGLRVMRCEACGLGVVESIPVEPELFYDDAYYGADKVDENLGYADYKFTSEHGVSWAATLVPLLKTGGRILDIGCADGSLLSKLLPYYERCGIEVNSKMAERAALFGVTILGSDLLNRDLLRQNSNSFDVVTAIAVFEHLPDLRLGFEISLELLKPDGILLFEVPYISADHDNRVWFESSLEHIYYPSGKSLRQLVEDLGAKLVGGEVYINDFASNYIGIVFKDPAIADALQLLFNAVTSIRDIQPDSGFRLARLFLMLAHAANSTPDLLEDLKLLSPAEISPELLRRLVQLWNTDLRRLAEAHRYRDLTAATMGQTITEQARAMAEQTEQLAAAKADADRWGAELAAARAEADRQAEQLAAAKAEADRQAEQLAAAKAEADRRAEELAAAKAEGTRQGVELGAAKAELIGLNERLVWLRDNERILRNELDDVLNSPHWKIAKRLKHVLGGPRRLAHLQRDFSRSIRTAIRSRRPEKQVGADVDIPVPPLFFDARTCMTDSVSTDDDMNPWPADRPLISVIIPSFNYGHFLAEAVDSVLAQTLANLEVIVVEGGSTDAESRRLALTLARPRTRVVAQDTRHLVGANRNLGISQARGKYICCLDADDMLAPTYLEKAIFLMETYGYDVLSCGLQFFGTRRGRYSPMESPTLADIVEANQVMTAGVFPRRLWREVGGYRDSDRDLTGHVHEDWMFWTNLAARGARVHNLSRDHLLLYRSHGPSLSTSPGHPMDVHGRLIRQALADQIGPEAIDRSRQAAARIYRNKPPCGFVPVRQGPTLLLAAPFLILGGAERLLSRIVEHLVEQGWHVVITTSIDPGEGHGDTTAWFEAATREIYHLPRFLKEDQWSDFVHYLMSSRNVDVLWVVGSAAVYEMLPALRAEFPRLRVVDLLFNTVGHTANNRKYASLIDLILVENAEVLGYLRGLGETEDRMKQIQSGVNLDLYTPGTRAEEVTSAIGAAPGDLIVGFSGRWSGEKNPIAFVELARSLQDLPIHFVMTGAGAMRPEVEQAVISAGLRPGKFHLAGEVEDVIPWLRSYDVLVLPSKLDGRPVVVMESLAMGVPVVASRVGALPELIEDGVSGYLCAPDRIEEFVDSVRRLEGDRALLAQMKSAARCHAEKTLDERGMLKHYEEQLRALVRAPAPIEN
jgi:O-antigen biosynthesis protein